MAKQKDTLLDHDYDGIQELDNDLPPWWLWLFYITIAIAVVYFFHYHVFKTGDLMIAEYNKEMDPNWKPIEETSRISPKLIKEYRSPYYSPKGDVTPKVLSQFDEYIGPNVDFAMLIMEALRRYDANSMDKLKAAFDQSVGAKVDFSTLVAEAMARADEDELERLKTSFPKIYASLTAEGGEIIPRTVEESTATKPAAVEIPKVAALNDAASLANGKAVFEKNCVSCHGKAGEGGIGPNLTDDYWIHGAGMSNVVHIINVGVPAKGMIAWRGTLKEQEIQEVASFVLTLHGTEPLNAKKAQGIKVEYPLSE